MKLFSEEERKTLFANSKNAGTHHVPVACLFVRNLNCRFMISSLDPEKPNMAYGLCDYDTKLSVQHVNLEEIQQQAEAKNDKLRSSSIFVAHLPLTNYLEMAQEIGTLRGLIDHESKTFEKTFTKLYGLDR